MSLAGGILFLPLVVFGIVVCVLFCYVFKYVSISSVVYILIEESLERLLFWGEGSFFYLFGHISYDLSTYTYYRSVVHRWHCTAIFRVLCTAACIALGKIQVVNRSSLIEIFSDSFTNKSTNENQFSFIFWIGIPCAKRTSGRLGSFFRLTQTEN